MKAAWDEGYLTKLLFDAPESKTHAGASDPMQSFVYPVALAEAPEGGFIVTCRDLPELITQGDNRDAALFLAMREQHVNQSELARRLGVGETEARRILDPRHGTKIPTLKHTLPLLGKRPERRIG